MGKRRHPSNLTADLSKDTIAGFISVVPVRRCQTQQSLLLLASSQKCVFIIIIPSAECLRLTAQNDIRAEFDTKGCFSHPLLEASFI